MSDRLAGIMYVKVDGEQLELQGGFECPASEVSREGVLSTSGVVGYKETIVKPYIKGKFIFTPDFPLETLQTNTAMTITAELSNGRVYTLSDAWVEGEAKISGDDGTIDLEFAGKRGIWQ